MASPRYLIGQGEKLSEEISRPPRGMGDKAHPYSFVEARRRLAPQWAAAAASIEALPELACPGGAATLEVMLHPSYLAKSYYPGDLIHALKLTHLGSRAVHITPSKVVSARALDSDKGQPAPVLYLAGDAEKLIKFSRSVGQWTPNDDKVEDAFRRIERVATPGPGRLKSSSDRFADRKSIPLEVVLHNPEESANSVVLSTFAKYLRSFGITFDRDRLRQAGGLAFVPIVAPRTAIEDVLNFSFLRALREAPRIVSFDPLVRSISGSFPVTLPNEDAAAPDLSVAIFDGGLPDNHGLDRWVTLHDAPGVGAPDPKAQRHGLAVTSAFLFGPLAQGQPAPRPFANVDHWRVCGQDQAKDDFEAFDLLDRIEDVLTSRRYDFINISLGPDYALDDDDISPWTARLDQILASGETVATIACGNNGDRNQVSKLHRIQPPSDGVNVLGVGASDRFGPAWQRAAYSAWGPGRSPGYVKPDFLAFGGSHASPFLALEHGAPAAACGLMGTSFAAPVAMRAGAGVRAQFADPLWAPAVKALLVHHARPDVADRIEAGWGFLSHSLGDLVLCDDYEAHIVYQRQMPMTGAVRLYLPIPDSLKGKVEIKATFSFYCEVDPEDAINYTRAGLEIQFRPDTLTMPKPYIKGGRLITPTTPVSDTFFSAKNFYATEHLQRDDAQKWETTLSQTKSKLASSLRQPAFDVSYIAREHGHSGRRSANMKFALALTIRNRSAKDLYDRVIASSGNRLQPMRARTNVQVPIRSRT
jgi:hypothetical protein